MEEGFCSLGSSHPGAFCLERRSEEKGTQRTWAVCLLNTLVYPTPHPRLASLVQGAATSPCHSILSRTCFSLHQRS